MEAQVTANGSTLSISMPAKNSTVSASGAGQPLTARAVWEKWQSEGRGFWQQINALAETLDSSLAGKNQNERP